jgi:hypothetical protein
LMSDIPQPGAANMRGHQQNNSSQAHMEVPVICQAHFDVLGSCCNNLPS